MIVTYIDSWGQEVSEPIEYALSYAEMAWDIEGAKPILLDSDGKEVKYYFNMFGRAIRENQSA